MDVERLLAVAGEHRLLPTRTLGRLGLSSAAQRRWRAEGWLTDVRAGVVLVGGGTPTRWQHAVAALLAAGDDAALSHWTAARIHRLACAGPPGEGSPIEISVPRPRHPKLAGCVIHRVARLEGDDVVTVRGARVTSPVRTLLDLAPSLSPTVLEKTVDEGLVGRLWDVPSLAAAVRPGGRRRGLGSLRRVLADRTADQRVDSTLEQRVTRAVQCLGPFETGHQVVIEGRVFVLDVAWPAQKVGAECDGWETRGRSRGKFDHDRRRNNLLASHGWSIVHLTSAMTDDEMRQAVFRMLMRAAAG